MNNHRHSAITFFFHVFDSMYCLNFIGGCTTTKNCCLFSSPLSLLSISVFVSIDGLSKNKRNAIIFFSIYFYGMVYVPGFCPSNLIIDMSYVNTSST